MQRIMRLAFTVPAVLLALVGIPAIAAAQGVTTGALRGKVTDDAGRAVAGAVLTLVNTQTGLRANATSRADGLYNIENVTPGGPFTLNARAIGFHPVAHEGIRISLGQVVSLDLKLTPAAAKVTELTVRGAAESPMLSTARTGAAVYVSDSVIQRLPTIYRNFTDFISTAPQSNGTSVAGQNNRFNNIQIDGAVNNDLFGLGSTGTPGGQVNARPISVEAVKEFQVLIAPFDVRQGGFTGGLVNAVTRSGTNDFQGSSSATARTRASPVTVSIGPRSATTS